LSFEIVKGFNVAGKLPVLSSSQLAYALDQMSKNALADIVVDMARASVGENAPEDDVIAFIQSHASAVQRLRGDKPLSLAAAIKKHETYRQHYINKTGPFEQVCKTNTAEENELVRKAAEYNKEKLGRPYDGN